MCGRRFGNTRLQAFAAGKLPVLVGLPHIAVGLPQCERQPRSQLYLAVAWAAVDVRFSEIVAIVGCEAGEGQEQPLLKVSPDACLPFA